MSDKALVTQQSVGQTAIALARMSEHRALMEAYVKGQMVEGLDYGKVPGTEKNTLMKPGAEKLNRLFGLTPLLPREKMITIEDWIGEQHGGTPLFSYKYCCEIREDGKIVTEAYGSCNSWESKYRWRWVSETDLPSGMDKANLPKRGGMISEFDFAVDKAETTGKYGKPVSYWQAFRDAMQNGTAREIKKKIKSGEERKAWEIETTVYRIPNDDIFSQVNTIDKMAQKRALVAATLVAVNASEFFTQDMEDFADNVIEGQFRVVEETKQPQEQPKQQEQKKQAAQESTRHWTDDLALIEKFNKFTTEKGLTVEQSLEALGVKGLLDYKGTREEAKVALLAYIEKHKEPVAA